jgi:hypothetical protein
MSGPIRETYKEPEMGHRETENGNIKKKIEEI